MADAILLSQETYDRLMEMLEDYEKGNLTVIFGDGFKIDEEGPDGRLVSIDGTDECPD